MPILEQVEDITDIACDCCGFKTIFSSGIVFLEDENEEMDYLARWTDGKADHDMYFLVYLEPKDKYASLAFNIKENAFTILNPSDNDWGDVDEEEMLMRLEIVDQPISGLLFTAMNEILENDKSINKFLELAMIDLNSEEEDEL